MLRLSRSCRAGQVNLSEFSSHRHYNFHIHRSRNLIIRELQRTNLDVNLAVNNLLSRDEEGDDDADDSQGDYVPEDLISLLDAGISADHPSVIIDADAMFNEDMFGYSQTRGRSSSTARR